MASRLELHEKLRALLGTNNVYFQPPESMKLEYPCIVYSKNNVLGRYANNKSNYFAFDRYELIYIYKNPDDDFKKELIGAFDYCRLDRHYISDNLYHDALTLYC